MSSSRDFTSSLSELVNILQDIGDRVMRMAYPRTVEADFDRRRAVPGKGQERLSKSGIGTKVVRKRRGALRIIATGLLIFNAALSIKYGMKPCMRFSPASDSDASSAATK